MSKRLPIVGVMGSGTEPHAERAAALGTWLGTRGVHLLTGGGPGAMAAVAEAFTAVEGRLGLSLGVLPWDQEAGATRAGYPNPFVELPIATHLHLSGLDGGDVRSRNAINVLSSDVVVALPGGHGTSSEVALALTHGRPVIAFVDARDAIPDLPDAVPSCDDLSDLRAFVDPHLARAEGVEHARLELAPPPGVRRLGPADASAYQALRLLGLKDAPTAFASSHEEERAYSAETVAARLAPEGLGATFGAHVDGALVAVATLLGPTKHKLAHRGELVAVYAAAAARGRGLGRAVCLAALHHARETLGLTHVVLGVNRRNDAARALYRSLGFTVYGLEPGFLVVNGEPQDELLMLRTL